jgi:hypothetical protein
MLIRECYGVVKRNVYAFLLASLTSANTLSAVM